MCQHSDILNDQPRKSIKVAAAIIYQDNRILATQRGYGNYKGFWEFPGGKNEPGEKMEETLQRELREEMEAEVVIKRLFDSVEWDYPEFHLSMDCFLCTLNDNGFKLLEHEDARWLTREDLMSVKWLPADYAIIEKIKEDLFDTEQTMESLSINIQDHGAELTSIRYKGREYLWQGDPTFWKRHAPILFPIVGKVWQNTYRVNGTEYHLPQHGFARDNEFEIKDHCKYQLTSTPDTLQVYPYPFQLSARYEVKGNTVTCDWEVLNSGEQTMYYQIGAHPAFNFPDFDPSHDIYGYLQLQHKGKLLSEISLTKLSANGYALPERDTLVLTDGAIPITQDTFAHDALVLEDSQVDYATLLDRDRKPFLKVEFDAPVVGFWSPVGAPFCCIEPWYGRADDEGFSGDISERKHIQKLPPKQVFTFRYKITAL